MSNVECAIDFGKSTDTNRHIHTNTRERYCFYYVYTLRECTAY